MQIWSLYISTKDFCITDLRVVESCLSAGCCASTCGKQWAFKPRLWVSYVSWQVHPYGCITAEACISEIHVQVGEGMTDFW